MRVRASSIWRWEERCSAPPNAYESVKQMNRTICILVGLILSMGLTNGCDTTRETISPTVTREAKTHSNSQYKFSFAYPPDWMIESEGYQFVILTPLEEKSWQPSTPADIPRDPKVRLDFGEYIRERLGPAHFPATIDSDILRTWLEQRVSSGQFRGLSERRINNYQAFEITEIRDPGCERVIYWRPANLKSLVRISTGCESPYLDEFSQIVNSLQQME